MYQNHIVPFHQKNNLSLNRPYILQNPTLMYLCKNNTNKTERVQNESLEWLRDPTPIWSRLNKRNASGKFRQLTSTKLKNYDIEIEGILLSLWGEMNLKKPIFAQSGPGKQYLACCVMALCATRIYPLGEWSPEILDSIIINGNRYYEQSINNSTATTNKTKIPTSLKIRKHTNFNIDDLNANCWLDSVHFHVHIENVTNGRLYGQPRPSNLNLAESLMYFFSYFQMGIIHCMKRYLAFGFVPGPYGGYFLYDCQSSELPLFPCKQAGTYILMAKNLQMLLYCIVVTLHVYNFHQPFVLYSIELDSEFCDPIHIGKSME